MQNLNKYSLRDFRHVLPQSFLPLLGARHA